MNWLTTQMARLQSFGELHGNASDVAGSNLRRLWLKYLGEALRGIGVELELANIPDGIRWQLDNSHLFTEDALGAERRIDRAQAISFDNLKTEEVLLFTIALSDGQGTVLYLPDDTNSENEDVQLFSVDDHGHISRWHLTGNLTPSSAYLTNARLAEHIGACSDGPCLEVNQGCGGRCVCCKCRPEEVGTKGRFSWRKPRPVSTVAVLKCHPLP